MKPFAIKDCALLVRMSGLPPAYNLRDLRERIAVCADDVLYHHFCETPLRPTFDNPDYRNDFAVWTRKCLGDRMLAERLGIVDPYAFESTAQLRAATLDLIEERLAELTPWVPTVRPGREFFFLEATTVVFDTGEQIPHPLAMPHAIRKMNDGSVFFHFLESRRRHPVGVDDFSAWLQETGDEFHPYIEAIGAIDFYFLTLKQLRAEIHRVLTEIEVMR
jgi:hypothetical protein